MKNGRPLVLGGLFAALFSAGVVSGAVGAGDAKGGYGAGADWPDHGGGVDESGYSRLGEIRGANVSRLGLAWSLDLPGEVTLQAAQGAPACAHQRLLCAGPTSSWARWVLVGSRF